jgi:thiamine biosynthesis protein ThiS
MVCNNVKFILNGYPEDFDEPSLTIQSLLEMNQEDDPAVIVELNGKFVHRKYFSICSVEEGDRVEFIHPSFGG